jgi:hypothetical protein
MLKDVHIGCSPLSLQIFAYRGKNGVATSKSEPLTQEAVFSVASLILGKGEPQTVTLEDGTYKLTLVKE